MTGSPSTSWRGVLLVAGGLGLVVFLAGAVGAQLAGPPSAAGWAATAGVLVLAAAVVVLLARRQEAAAAGARRALTGGIAHEMRTPLAQVRMYTEMLLLQQERSADERTQWLEAIDREAHRLGEVMENLLLYLHTAENAGFPARQPTDLASVVEDLAAGFAQRAARRGVRLVVDAPSGAVVSADLGPLRQAVANLLDNAIRHGPAGRTVAVSLSSTGGEVVVEVTDEGAGVPAASRVPGPLASPGVARVAGGSGLGLLVASRVATAHGGRLRISDPALVGSRVAIVLPCLRSPAAGYTAPRRNA